MSPKSVKNQDPNIGWIQFIDATQTYYIATVYVPHGIKKQAKQIYQTLMLNCIELQQKGTTMATGRDWSKTIDGDVQKGNALEL